MSVFSKLRRRSKPRLTYSSKEYVEQLRTVHFALLTVSAGLLLVILSARPYNPLLARIQLDAVDTINQIFASPDDLADTGTNERILNTSSDLDNGSAILATLKNPAVQLSGGHGLKPILVPIDLDATKSYLETVPADTIDDFATRWEGLKNDVIFLRFSTIRVSSFCISHTYSRCRIVESQKTNSTEKMELEVRYDTSKPDDEIVDETVIPLGSHVSKLIGDASPAFGSGPQRVELAVTSYQSIHLSQDQLRWRVPPIQLGDFAASFPDLYQATKGELRFFKLKDVHKYLDSDSTNSEVFEAFGVKIPAQQLTSWGIVVIIVVQLYLFIYLRAFKRPLEPKDAAWDVGWFAASEALLPRSVFFVTVWALPPLTVILLTKYALDQRLQLTPFRFNQDARKISEFLAFAHDFPVVPFMLLGCLLALLLGYLNWSNRPRIRRESVASRSQLFE